MAVTSIVIPSAVLPPTSETMRGAEISAGRAPRKYLPGVHVRHVGEKKFPKCYRKKRHNDKLQDHTPGNDEWISWLTWIKSPALWSY